MVMAGALAYAQTPSAASQPSSSAAQAAPPFSQRSPRYQLRPGDTFDLSFEFSPEFNQSVTVQPDGFVTLRNIADVKVGGMTLPELTSAITQAYSKILKDPVISILLKDFEKPYFIATGQVAHPGKYDLRGDTTLMEAIAMAGGFSDSAKNSQVVVYHRVSKEWMEGRVINVKKMTKENNLAEDVLLTPGDMVFVAKSSYSKIQRFIPAPGLGLGFTPF
jgi:polysaccharide export outer membrane protein